MARLRHDSVAIVYGQKDDNEIINMLSKIWLPNDENFMDYQEIEAFIIDLMKQYKVKEAAYDRHFLNVQHKYC